MLENEGVHPDAGEFVDADNHGFTRFPGGGVVLDKVLGDLLQAIVSGDDVVVALEFSLQALLYVYIVSFTGCF